MFDMGTSSFDDISMSSKDNVKVIDKTLEGSLLSLFNEIQEEIEEGDKSQNSSEDVILELSVKRDEKKITSYSDSDIGAMSRSEWLDMLCDRGDDKATSKDKEDKHSDTNKNSSIDSSSLSSSSSSSSSSTPSSLIPVASYPIYQNIFSSQPMELYNTPEHIGDWQEWLQQVAVEGHDSINFSNKNIMDYKNNSSSSSSGGNSRNNGNGNSSSSSCSSSASSNDKSRGVKGKGSMSAMWDRVSERE